MVAIKVSVDRLLKRACQTSIEQLDMGFEKNPSFGHVLLEPWNLIAILTMLFRTNNPFHDIESSFFLSYDVD